MERGSHVEYGGGEGGGNHGAGAANGAPLFGPRRVADVEIALGGQRQRQPVARCVEYLRRRLQRELEHVAGEPGPGEVLVGLNTVQLRLVIKTTLNLLNFYHTQVFNSFATTTGKIGIALSKNRSSR